MEQVKNKLTKWYKHVKRYKFGGLFDLGTFQKRLSKEFLTSIAHFMSVIVNNEYLCEELKERLNFYLKTFSSKKIIELKKQVIENLADFIDAVIVKIKKSDEETIKKYLQGGQKIKYLPLHILNKFPEDHKLPIGPKGMLFYLKEGLNELEKGKPLDFYRHIFWHDLVYDYKENNQYNFFFESTAEIVVCLGFEEAKEIKLLKDKAKNSLERLRNRLHSQFLVKGTYSIIRLTKYYLMYTLLPEYEILSEFEENELKEIIKRKENPFFDFPIEFQLSLSEKIRTIPSISKDNKGNTVVIKPSRKIDKKYKEEMITNYRDYEYERIRGAVDDVHRIFSNYIDSLDEKKMKEIKMKLAKRSRKKYKEKITSYRKDEYKKILRAVYDVRRIFLNYIVSLDSKASKAKVERPSKAINKLHKISFGLHGAVEIDGKEIVSKKAPRQIETFEILYGQKGFRQISIYELGEKLRTDCHTANQYVKRLRHTIKKNLKKAKIPFLRPEKPLNEIIVNVRGEGYKINADTVLFPG